ncbi:MAG: hypothetical protein LBL20_06590, partial [Treponema sp.]|jgi:hypothetical protein|nr:hypothetical protein [Treponema sp.]
LGEDTIEMYLFGRDVASLFKDYVMRHEKFSEFRQKVKKCQQIYHYAKNINKRFERNVPTQLGLDSIDGAKTYPPLWDDLEESVEPQKKSSKVILVKKGTGEEKIVR